MSLQKLIEKLRFQITHANATETYSDVLNICDVAEKAKAYIDVCPCDPDITLEQIKAWREYQDALKICEG